MRNSIYCQSRHLCRYQEIRGNQLRRQGQVREQLHGLDISGRRRLRQLECVKKQSINTDLTTREMLVLAEARCHYVALKLEAHDSQGSQNKMRRTQMLKGDTIVFPHEPMSTPQEFGARALKADLGAIRFYLLVGPNGAQGHLLEETAIKIDDYRLDHSTHSASAALALSSVWLAGPTIALKVQGACPHFCTESIRRKSTLKTALTKKKLSAHLAPSA